MEDASLERAAPLIHQVEERLLEQLRAAGSADALRDLTIEVPEMTRALALALFTMHLLGRAQVWSEVEPADHRLSPLAAAVFSPEVTPEPLPFEEAIAYFRPLVPMSSAAFAELEEAAQRKAFRITAGATEQISLSIKDMLDSALKDGLSLRDFQAGAAEVLESAGVSARSPWYWETVYRTNLGQSYEVGRHKQLTDDYVRERRPFWQYLSQRLPTSRPSHVEKHNLIFRWDHPFWKKWEPKNGFNCRCSRVSLSEAEMKRDGLKESTRTNFRWPDPDPGFERGPGGEDV